MAATAEAVHPATRAVRSIQSSRRNMGERNNQIREMQ